MARKRYDWHYIRALFETGQTAYQIAKRPDAPSKQAIQKRANAEGWIKPDQGQSRLPIVAKALTVNSERLTDELLAVLLDLIANGATREVACAACGISTETLRRWCHEDSRLGEMLDRARAGTVAGYLGTVHQAQHKDWKAATWMLTNAPDTRDHFGAGKHDGKVEVVINIDRPPVAAS